MLRCQNVCGSGFNPGRILRFRNPSVRVMLVDRFTHQQPGDRRNIWSAMQDLNLRPRAPKARALPSCANRRCGKDERYSSFDLRPATEPPLNFVELVGMTGFEPATPAPPVRCSTKLSHIPKTLVKVEGFEPSGPYWHQHPRLDGYQVTVLHPDWSGRQDLNLHILASKARGLPLPNSLTYKL